MLQKVLKQKLWIEGQVGELTKVNEVLDKRLRTLFLMVAQKAKRDFNRAHDTCQITDVYILAPFSGYLCVVDTVVSTKRGRKKYTFAGDSVEAKLVRKFLETFFIKETKLSPDRIAIFCEHPVIFC